MGLFNAFIFTVDVLAAVAFLVMIQYGGLTSANKKSARKPEHEDVDMKKAA